MALSDRACKTAAPGEKVRKLSDGNGLQLWVMPSGSKLWRLAYRLDGKQRLFAIGPYPEISLAQARAARDEARKLIREGKDPVAHRRLLAADDADAPTFGDMARDLMAKNEAEGRREKTIARKDRLLKLAFVDLEHRPIGAITASEILSLCRKHERKGQYVTANRMCGVIGEVFRFGIASQVVDADPTHALRGALISPKHKPYAAVTTWKAFGPLLKAIDGYDGQPGTRTALLLLAYLFPRPGELRNAFWDEFDLERKVWVIPAGRMKMARDHKKPLPDAAVKLLEELREIWNGSALVFPGLRSNERPMSENTLNAALRRLGYTKEEMTSHGFRSTASSLINEDGQWSPDAVERELSHEEGNKVRRAYHRAEYWDERVRMMDWWAGKIDELRAL
jgi:integrase